MSGGINFSLDFNTSREGAKCNQATHYWVYVLGSFSGRRDVPWEQRKITEINIDNFERVMARIRPTLLVDAGLALTFESLDDFHPDAWLPKIPILADLLELKRQLKNPGSADQAAARIKAFLPSASQPENLPQAPESGETQEQMLERLLGRKPETTSSRPDTVERLIEGMVSPYVSKAVEPQHRELIDLIDATISQYLRSLLHHQDFQRLESLWRATAGMINEEAADEQRFFLVDVDQMELLAAAGDGRDALEQAILTHVQSGNGEQQVLLVGDYRFSYGGEGGEQLVFFSRLAKACKGYFLGSGDDAWLEGASGDNDRQWQQYWRHIDADRVMLAYPCYLLRLPYGVKRDAIEALAFEECSAIPQSGELLWGNPAFLVARALLRAGLDSRTEESGFFQDIPCFTFDKDGEPVLQPGAELALTENQANALLSKGIMPVIGYRQRQGVRLPVLSTLADAG